MYQRWFALSIALAACIHAGSVLWAQPEQPIELTDYEQLTGNYQLPNGNVVAIDRFDMDGGQVTLLYSDYTSGVVRRLFPNAGDEFAVGPAFGVATPVELKVKFVRNQAAEVSELTLTSARQSRTARRVSIISQPVSFQGADATLSGTLLIPPGKGPHPAIVLLHGSGPLTRYSFGPYPHFFTSLGLAVLIYDKRSAGLSTGGYMAPSERYPGRLGFDALEAVRFLEGRSEIDPKRIGLWGASEGGMLAMQVAAVSKEIAFVIDSSGFMMPLWQQIVYNIGAQLRADGFSQAEAAEAVDYEQRVMSTGRTGEGWAELSDLQRASVPKKWFKAWFGDFAGYSSLEMIRRNWSNVWSFDPLPALHSVSCPVLGLFGTLDTSTPAAAAASNMRRALKEGGNKDVTVRIFNGANHSLMEAHTGGGAEIPSLKRMVPFDTLRSWITKRIA